MLYPYWTPKPLEKKGKVKKGKEILAEEKRKEIPPKRKQGQGFSKKPEVLVGLAGATIFANLE